MPWGSLRGFLGSRACTWGLEDCPLSSPPCPAQGGLTPLCPDGDQGLGTRRGRQVCWRGWPCLAEEPHAPIPGGRMPPTATMHVTTEGLGSRARWCCGMCRHDGLVPWPLLRPTARVGTADPGVGVTLPGPTDKALPEAARVASGITEQCRGLCGPEEATATQTMWGREAWCPP